MTGLLHFLYDTFFKSLIILIYIDICEGVVCQCSVQGQMVWDSYKIWYARQGFIVIKRILFLKGNKEVAFSLRQELWQ